MKNIMTIIGTGVVMGSMGFSAYTLWNMKNEKCKNGKCNCAKSLNMSSN